MTAPPAHPPATAPTSIHAWREAGERSQQWATEARARAAGRQRRRALLRRLTAGLLLAGIVVVAFIVVSGVVG